MVVVICVLIKFGVMVLMVMFCFVSSGVLVCMRLIILVLDVV